MAEQQQGGVRRRGLVLAGALGADAIAAYGRRATGVAYRRGGAVQTARAVQFPRRVAAPA